MSAPATPSPWPGTGAARGGRGPRLQAVAALAAAVLLVHAGLLTGLPTGQGADDRPGATPLVVRQVPLARPAESGPAPADEAAAPDQPPPAARPPRVVRPVVAVADHAAVPAVSTGAVEAAPAAGPVAEAASAPVARPDEPHEPDAVGADLGVAAAGAASPAADPANSPATATATAEPATEAPTASAAPTPGADPGPADAAGQRLPTYATQLPPATVLHYELRRGLLTGAGELAWRPQAGRYELAIEGTAFGMPVLTQLSTGGFDTAGLAPERFVDRRRGRDVRAANFQRDKGVISWSTTPAEVALQPGAQDRLSWMLQLAAVVNAQPARWSQPGARVLMQVAGARGDVDVWTFVVAGREAVDVVGQRIDDTLLLRRAPRKPYDTEAQVWLDPARHHLPVRLRLATAGGGNDSLEFVLQP